MASMLDIRPSGRKPPILFGRALVEQRKLEQDTRSKERDDVRLEAAQRATEKHQQLADQIALEKLAIDKQKQSLEMELKLKELRDEKLQLEAFSRAQRQIGQLSPTDPLLPGKIAQIQADNSILFAGKGTQYGHALGGMVTELFQRQKAIETAKEKKVEAATKFEAEHGVKVPLDAKGEPDLAAASAARIKAGQDTAAASGMMPNSYTDPQTGITSKAPVDKTQMDRHQLQQMYLSDYHAVEKERIGAAKLMKGVKSGGDIPPEITLLDSRRTQALKNLQSVGINLEAGQSDAPPPTDAIVPPPILDKEALAKSALEDPEATAEHKSAARKLLGYQDEQPQE